MKTIVKQVEILNIFWIPACKLCGFKKKWGIHTVYIVFVLFEERHLTISDQTRIILEQLNMFHQ